MRLLARLRAHWPEYAIEAWALGTFMVSAGAATAIVELPELGVRGLIASDSARRALIGLAMGLTAIALIYSPWGRRSGAHMNPAVTLAFLALGKVRGVDVVGYVAAQFAGGVLGAALVLALLGERFSAPPVAFVLTQATHGPRLAFALEWLISCVLMSVVLALSSRERLARYTGLAAGALVAAFIALEAPYSGMSMNPARSFASAAVAGQWADLWIYFVAPPLGMLAAAFAHSRRGAVRAGCAKLVHGRDVRCIHCGYEPRYRTKSVSLGGLTHGNH
jgi:aquaporin Z